jgi:hypothetical protein
MLPTEFEPAIPATERPQIYADREATGIGKMLLFLQKRVLQ